MAHKCHAACGAFDAVVWAAPALQQRRSCTIWSLFLESSTWMGTSAAWKARMGGELLLLHTQYVDQLDSGVHMCCFIPSVVCCCCICKFELPVQDRWYSMILERGQPSMTASSGAFCVTEKNL
jgi:hypothetical protein